MLDKIKAKLGLSKTPPVIVTPTRFKGTVRSTTATRREAQRKLDASRMWISKDIPDDVQTAILLGVPHFIPQIMRKAKGTTYDVGNNMVKAAGDKHGKNNKTRRALRRYLINDRNQRVAAQENLH